jgi:dienelactone hydrolase
MFTFRSFGFGILISCYVVPTLSAQDDRPTDEWLTKPVDDQTFATYLEFFAYETDLPLNRVVLESSEEDGLIEEKLAFQSTPGQIVTARVFRPRVTGAEEQGGVVYIHSGGPSGKDAGSSLAFCRLMARAGWTVLAFDLLHFGERNAGLLDTYGAREKADRLYNQPSTYLEFVTQTVKDVGRSYDLLVLEYDVDPDRVALVGYSRGAQMSMIAGGAEKRLAAVALMHGGHFDRFENGHRPAACGANYIGRINPRPLLMINGEADTDYFPDTAVRPLQKLLGESTTIRWTGAGHGMISEEDRTVLVDWLRMAVPQ